jgi:predicted nucleic acid-binding protein
VKVLVDTSLWSLALRRSRSAPLSALQVKQVANLADLVRDGRATMAGAIRQALLCGIKSAKPFEQLRAALRAFDDVPVVGVNYERAADFFNRCRAVGVQGSNTDVLICALAHAHNMPIATCDGDFVHYARHLPITLYQDV